MDYAGFKNHLTAFLWKPNDAVLSANLDNLIGMANAVLNRDLKTQERQASAQLTLDSLEVDLPADYFSIRSVECDDTTLPIRDFSYVQPSEITSLRRQGRTSSWQPYYSIVGTQLVVCGPIASPTTVTVQYTAAVPDYQTADASWVADNYLDLYTYATLMHAALFIREDERVSLWTEMYSRALESCNTNAEWYQNRAVPASTRLPRNPNATRRR